MSWWAVATTRFVLERKDRITVADDGIVFFGVP